MDDTKECHEAYFTMSRSVLENLIGMPPGMTINDLTCSNPKFGRETVLIKVRDPRLPATPEGGLMPELKPGEGLLAGARS